MEIWSIAVAVCFRMRLVWLTWGRAVAPRPILVIICGAMVCSFIQGSRLLILLRIAGGQHTPVGHENVCLRTFLCMGSNFCFREHRDTNVRNIAFLSNKYACYVYCLYKRFLLKYDKKIASIVWLIGSFLAFS